MAMANNMKAQEFAGITSELPRFLEALEDLRAAGWSVVAMQETAQCQEAVYGVTIRAPGDAIAWRAHSSMGTRELLSLLSNTVSMPVLLGMVLPNSSRRGAP